MKNINKFMTIMPQVKCADSSECFGWHQDCAYADLGPAHKLVTAWVALSDSNEDNGCVRMVSGARYPGLRLLLFHTNRESPAGRPAASGRAKNGGEEPSAGPGVVLVTSFDSLCCYIS